jgi:hypothetical protein|tara:strand:+ start:2000 stop:2212 length:213 start_codon:yes stop_codon:yes gene_type:complete
MSEDNIVSLAAYKDKKDIEDKDENLQVDNEKEVPVVEPPKEILTTDRVAAFVSLISFTLIVATLGWAAGC